MTNRPRRLLFSRCFHKIKRFSTTLPVRPLPCLAAASWCWSWVRRQAWKGSYPRHPLGTHHSPPQAVTSVEGSLMKAVPGGARGHCSPPSPPGRVLVAEPGPEASAGLGTVAAGLGRWDSVRGLTSAAPVSPAGRSRRLLAAVSAAGAAINPSANGKLERRAHTSRVTLWGERGRGELR